MMRGQRGNAWRLAPGACLRPAAVMIASLIMLRWTWLRWPDVSVDFGQQLYVAWQLAEGQVLYRDVAYLYGPLAPNLNALLFRLFGASVKTLVYVNLAILAVILALLYRILKEVSDNFAATLGSLVFVTIFAFGHLLPIGNYNYVTPYSHDATHGLTLSLLSLYLLWRFHSTGSLWSLVGAGASLGLVFLTKAELFVAVVAGVTVALIFIARSRRQEPSWLRWFVASAAFPIFVTFGLFLLRMAPTDAATAILGSWAPILKDEVIALTFYRTVMGTVDIMESLQRLLVWAGWYGAVFGPAALLALALRGDSSASLVTAALLFIAALVGFGVIWDEIQWPEIGRPLPLLTVCLSLLAVRGAARSGPDDPHAPRRALRAAFCVFGFMLLLKMVLNARFAHFGFVLAMPATLLVVAALSTWIPSAIKRRGGSGICFQAVAMGVLLVAIYAHLQVEKFFLSRKTYLVGKGADQFFADFRGVFIAAALDAVKPHIGNDGTLAVFPEGPLLNYLLRRRNSTPYTVLNPPEIMTFGEDVIRNAYHKNPPDLIGIVYNDPSDLGLFGRDYATSIMLWVQTYYRPLLQIGPLEHGRYGILVLKRVGASAPQAGGPRQ